MNHTAKITFIAAQILLLFFTDKLTFCNTSNADSLQGLSPQIQSAPHADTLNLPVAMPESLVLNPDSLRRQHQKETLTRLETERKYFYYHDGADFLLYAPFHVTSKNFYGVDGISPTDLLSFNPFFTVAKYGLSSRMNRSLLYGNVAPVNKFYSGTLLFDRNTGIVDGTDQVFSTEISDLNLLNGGNIRYQYAPLQLAVPEVLLLWENGVFDETTLAVRFSRPMSRNLKLNVFSNFRSFKAQHYNQAADITSIFKRFSDSTSMTPNGYNPKTQEQVVGAGFSWSSQKNLDISLLIKYGDLSNECAIDKVARDKSSLSYALLQQYPLQASMLSTYAINDKFSIDFDLKLLNESIFRTTGQTIENMLRPVRDKSKINELNAAVKPAYRLGGNDTLGIVYNIRTDKYELFNDSDLITIQNRPSIFYTNNFQTNHISGTIRASGGTLSLKFADTADIKPFFYLGAEFLHNSNRYRIYAEKDDIPFIVNMDSIVYDQELLDSYIKAGCEFYKKWRFADLTLGYQFVYGVKDSSVIKSWPFYTAPYKQPGSVFIVGPSFGRWKGLALRTNFMISDIKPYLKASGALTYEIHPVSTREYIDIALAFTYWSEREDVLFAGLSGWNVPIYDLSLQIAAHIRSFRLFYKISNLLNRNNSYIPGYYSPGITFRWGFNWYIQR